MYVCKNNKTIILLASSGVPSLNRGRQLLRQTPPRLFWRQNEETCWRGRRWHPHAQSRTDEQPVHPPTVAPQEIPLSVVQLRLPQPLCQAGAGLGQTQTTSSTTGQPGLSPPAFGCRVGGHSEPRSPSFPSPVPPSCCTSHLGTLQT